MESEIRTNLSEFVGRYMSEDARQGLSAEVLERVAEGKRFQEEPRVTPLREEDVLSVVTIYRNNGDNVDEVMFVGGRDRGGSWRRLELYSDGDRLLRTLYPLPWGVELELFADLFLVEKETGNTSAILCGEKVSVSPMDDSEPEELLAHLRRCAFCQ